MNFEQMQEKAFDETQAKLEPWKCLAREHSPQPQKTVKFILLLKETGAGNSSVSKKHPPQAWSPEVTWVQNLG